MIIDRLIDRLLTDGVTEHELERAKNKYEAQYTYSNVHFARRAATLAMAVMHDEKPGDAVKAYRSLTPAEIEDTAHTVLNPRHACTLIYRPIFENEKN